MARSNGVRDTPASFASSSSLARSAIQPVASVSAGPPLGGLYLKPPSGGGLCDGVTTTPSASADGPGALNRRIACDTAGVGVNPGKLPAPASTSTSTPLAANTSIAVRQAGSDRAWVS